MKNERILELETKGNGVHLVRRRDDISRTFIDGLGIASQQEFFGSCIKSWFQDVLEDWQIDLARTTQDLPRSRSYSLLALGLGGLNTDLDGLAHQIRYCRETFAHVPLVLLCDHVDTQLAVQCMSHGARGLISTDLDNQTVIHAIELILDGGAYLPTSATTRPAGPQVVPPPVIDDAFYTSPGRQLTPREFQVAELMMEGRPNKLIAFELQISEGTVKTYVRRILQKLDCRNRTQAAHRLAESGLASEFASRVATTSSD